MPAEAGEPSLPAAGVPGAAAAWAATLAFAAVLLAIFYGLWIRTANALPGWTLLCGYFAWVIGASILNHVLFETVIRRLR